MAVEVGPIISFLALRIVLAPSEVDVPRPTARATPVKRFREGLITEVTFRLELRSLGWTDPEIDRSLVQARLERDFDDFQDRLAALEDAFNKDLITFAEMKAQLLALIPDPAKALIVVDRLDFAKRPKPKPLTPEEPPTLTVGRLLAAFKAGIFTREALGEELAERGYSPADVELMIRTEEARLPKPKEAARKLLALGDLRAMFDLGVLTEEEFRTELISRTYTPEDAERIVNLQLARQRARLPKPKPEEFAALPLGDLKAMFSLGIITEEELRLELSNRNFSPEDVEREVALLLEKMGAAPVPA